MNVDINGLTATVKVSELQSTTREEGNKLEREQKAAMPKTRKRMGGSAVQRQKEVRTEINILGQTVDEATVSVGRFIDQAFYLAVSTERTIHGKGTWCITRRCTSIFAHLTACSSFWKQQAMTKVVQGLRM